MSNKAQMIAPVHTALITMDLCTQINEVPNKHYNIFLFFSFFCFLEGTIFFNIPAMTISCDFAYFLLEKFFPHVNFLLHETDLSRLSSP